MTDTRPYLIDPSRERLLAPPPRRVSRWTIAGHLAGALSFPGLIVASGVAMVVHGLQSDPTPIRVGGIIMCAGGILFIAGWIFFVGTWPQTRRDLRLLQEGVVILGEVTACSMIVSKGTNTHAEGLTSEYTQVTVTIEYSFVMPADVRKTGKSVKVYTEVPTSPRPEAGDAMAMLYLDEEKFLVL